jgi:enamine deaminase RidA (YjgF/YER057c/UK114 family)
MSDNTEKDAEQLREEMTQKLPLILADFKKVLETHGITGTRVVKFILVPDSEPEELLSETASNVECNEDICVVVH